VPSEGVLDTSLSWVTPSSGKGALGKWRAPYRKHRLDSEPGLGDHLTGRRAGGITRYPRGVYERAFKPREIGEGPLGTGCCCQPDSGNPTVRDERGAYGNGSSRQGCESNEVRVLCRQLLGIGRLAYPMHMKVTTCVLLGRKRHGCPVSQSYRLQR
jgi:hypothetical protein